MNNSFTRSLSVYLVPNGSNDPIAIGTGCPMTLSGKERMTLRPSFFELAIDNLSSSSAALLTAAHGIEVRCGSTVLAAGEISEVITRTEEGRPVTRIGFAFGLSLWRSSVSLTVSAGKTVSETMGLLLDASVSDLPLTCFTGDDIIFTRPQSFFGRTADALAELARTAKASPCYSPGGVAVIGNKPADSITSAACISADTGTAVTPALVLRESDLISAPKTVPDGTILKTLPIGLPMGTILQATWQGQSILGRLTSRALDCRTVSGPWQCEMLLEPLEA